MNTFLMMSVVLVVGNYIHQAVTDRDWMKVVSRTFIQVIILGIGAMGLVLLTMAQGCQ